MDDETNVAKIVPAVLAMLKNPAASKAKVAAAQEIFHRRQRETMEIVRRSIPTPKKSKDQLWTYLRQPQAWPMARQKGMILRP